MRKETSSSSHPCTDQPALGPRLFFSAQERTRLSAEANAHPKAWRLCLSRAQRRVETERGTPATALHFTRAFSSRPERVRGHFIAQRLNSWVEALGYAWQVTGDRQYLEAGAHCLHTAAMALPVNHPIMSRVSAGGRGDMMRALAIGLDWLGEGLSPQDRSEVECVARGYLDHTLLEVIDAWWQPSHNYIGVNIGAAGLLALLLPADEETRAQRLATVNRWLGIWLDEAFDEEGAYCEGFSYAAYGLENAVACQDAFERAGVETLWSHPRLLSVSHYLASILLPGRMVYDARNDAYYRGFDGTSLLRLAKAHHDGLAKWLWVHTSTRKHSVFSLVWRNEVQPKAPEDCALPLARHCRGTGLVCIRSGWKDDDLLFTIQAGAFRPVTHNQADKGHFNLYQRGSAWAVDSGYGNSRSAGGRAQSHAHSVVLVDGRGQALAGAGLGSDGSILACEERKSCHWVWVDATAAYRGLIAAHRHESRAGLAIPPESPGGRYPLHHGFSLGHAHRHVVWLKSPDGKPSAIVIFDDWALDGDIHEFRWQQLIPWEVKTRVDRSRALLANNGNDTMQIAIAAGADTRWSLENKRITEQSRAPGVPSQPVRYRCLYALVKDSRPRFATVMVPGKRHYPAPDVAIQHQSRLIKVSIRHPHRHDVVILDEYPRSRVEHQTGPLSPVQKRRRTQVSSTLFYE